MPRCSYKNGKVYNCDTRGDIPGFKTLARQRIPGLKAPSKHMNRTVCLASLNRVATTLNAAMSSILTITCQAIHMSKNGTPCTEPALELPLPHRCNAVVQVLQQRPIGCLVFSISFNSNPREVSRLYCLPARSREAPRVIPLRNTTTFILNAGSKEDTMISQLCITNVFSEEIHAVKKKIDT